MSLCHPDGMDERLAVALAALQRVEEVLDTHAGTEWFRTPETQEIQEAIAGIDAMSGSWDPSFGGAASEGRYVLSTRRPEDGRAATLSPGSVSPEVADRFPSEFIEQVNQAPRPGVVSGPS